MNFNRVLCVGVALGACGAAALAVRPKFDLRGHRGAIQDFDFDPTGQMIVSAGLEPQIRLWSMKTGRQVREMAPALGTITRDTLPSMLRRSVEAVRFAPDGSYIAEAAEEGNTGVVRLWDPKTGEPIKVLVNDARNIRCLAFSPDGKLLAANMRDGQRSDHKISLVDPKTGKVVGKELRGDRLAATMLAFSPDGKTLVSAGGRRIHIWDLDTRSLRFTIGTHKKAILSIAFAPDSEHFASSDDDENVRIWSAKTGKLVREFEHKQDGVRALAYSRSGRTLATGGEDNTIKLWNPKTGKYRDTLWGHTGPITVLRFSPTESVLASGSRDGTIAIWDFQEPDADKDATEQDTDEGDGE